LIEQWESRDDHDADHEARSARKSLRRHPEQAAEVLEGFRERVLDTL
jgi:hypothetical protein